MSYLNGVAIAYVFEFTYPHLIRKGVGKIYGVPGLGFGNVLVPKKVLAPPFQSSKKDNAPLFQKPKKSPCPFFSKSKIVHTPLFNFEKKSQPPYNS